MACWTRVSPDMGRGVEPKSQVTVGTGSPEVLQSSTALKPWTATTAENTDTSGTPAKREKDTVDAQLFTKVS